MTNTPKRQTMQVLYRLHVYVHRKTKGLSYDEVGLIPYVHSNNYITVTVLVSSNYTNSIQTNIIYIISQY